MTAPPDFTQKAIALAGHRSSSFIFEALEALESAYAAGAAAEREACARVVKKSYRLLSTHDFDAQTARQCREQCATLIRARARNTQSTQSDAIPTQYEVPWDSSGVADNTRDMIRSTTTKPEGK